MTDGEIGHKWWIRYAIVPLMVAVIGGTAGIITYLTSKKGNDSEKHGDLAVRDGTALLLTSKSTFSFEKNSAEDVNVWRAEPKGSTLKIRGAPDPSRGLSACVEAQQVLEVGISAQTEDVEALRSLSSSQLAVIVGYVFVDPSEKEVDKTFRAHIVAWRLRNGKEEMLYGPILTLKAGTWVRVIWNSAKQVKLGREKTLLAPNTFDTIGLYVSSDETYDGMVYFDDIRFYLLD